MPDNDCAESYQQSSCKVYQKGGGTMHVDLNEALLRAILELIQKCQTIEELRESVKRIMEEK